MTESNPSKAPPPANSVHDESGGDAADDQLLGVARHLFAALGYDEVSTQMISDAAGVDPGTVTERYGGKRDLYLAAMQRTTDEWLVEQELITSRFTPDADGLFFLFDRLLVHCLEHPELPRLWQHRRLSDASDITDLEERNYARMVPQTLALVRSAVRPDVDAEVALWTVSWSIMCYAQAGLPTPQGMRRPPNDPAMLSRMRAHLRWHVRTMARQD
ncbi:TetR/AcrR family transcriptional regulator [Actinomadura rugatobispora]|uniref:TetR/AcrR family transcriptional regulator n=1 Tax=Actinomadura rugatobispora TaxID=1994 RepID=A0ABW1ACY6_9ACTN|nr:TetR/AcrR family transcriptional regulator [Actinomadura rugatobispora]